jgi:hypothetical protein
MPVTATLGQLTTAELRSLRTAIPVVLNFPHLYEPMIYTKLDTLSSDLQYEEEDRARIEAESRSAAANIRPHI